jgi:hypothetical protein
MDEYTGLNRLIAETLFSPAMKGLPAFVEVTAELTKKISDHFSVPETDVEGFICETVHSWLGTSRRGSSLFKPAVFQVFNWRQANIVRKKDGIPPLDYPHLPLLLAFAIAAGDMGSEGGFKPNNYHSRLTLLLGYSETDKKIVENSYRESALELWQSLNHWLDIDWNESRGSGTVVALGEHFYIGMALSQALIRSIDRNKLPYFFRDHGLAAHLRLSLTDTKALVDEWVNRDDANFSTYKNPSIPFKSLWGNSDARERMAQIISDQLALWDGSIPSKSGSEITNEDFQLRIEMIEINFPRKNYEFSFALNAPTDFWIQSVEILTENSTKVTEIQMVGDETGWYRPSQGVKLIEPDSLLSRELTLRVNKTFTITRHPRKILIFKQDDITRRFFETDRIEIGSRNLIAIQDFSDNLKILENIIEDCARPGYQFYDKTKLVHVPDGWNFVAPVEVLHFPNPDLFPKNSTFVGLQPIFAGTLSILKGLVLPGRPTKFHADVPIEILGSVPGATAIKIQLTKKDETDQNNILVEKDIEGPTGILEVDFGNIDKLKADGDYEVTVSASETATFSRIASTILRVRSGNSPDSNSWEHSTKLVHDVSNFPADVFSARESTSADADYIHGARTITTNPRSSQSEVDLASRIPTEPWWGKVSPSEKFVVKTPLILNTPSSNSCFVRGAHRWELPPAIPNLSRRGFERMPGGRVIATCLDCGLQSKAVVNPWLAEAIKTKKNSQESAGFDWKSRRAILSQFEPSKENVVNGATILDALMHLGGGSKTALNSVAASLDPSALFAHELSNALDQIGYIEFKCDDFFRATNWVMPDAQFINQGEFGFFIGYFPKRFIAELKSIQSDLDIRAIDIFEGVPVHHVYNMKSDTIARMHSTLGIVTIESAAVNMINELPNFIDCCSSLPQRLIPNAEIVSKYNPDTNSWQRDTRVSGPGSYRFTAKYENIYGIVDSNSFKERRFRQCSADIAKHFQAVISGESLFAYNESIEALVVPKGARLPGLYGRAAVLASGRLPTLDASGKNLIYEHISKEFMVELARRFQLERSS